MNYSKFSAENFLSDLSQELNDSETRGQLKEEYAKNKRLIVNGIKRLSSAEGNGPFTLSRILQINSRFEDLANRAREYTTDKMPAFLVQNAVSLKLKEMLYAGDCLYLARNDPSASWFMDEFFLGQIITRKKEFENDLTGDAAQINTESDEFISSSRGNRLATLPESLPQVAIELMLDDVEAVTLKEIDILDQTHLEHFSSVYHKLANSFEAMHRTDDASLLKQLAHKGITRLFKKAISASKDLMQTDFSSGIDSFFRVLDSYFNFHSQLEGILVGETVDTLFLRPTIQDQSFLASDPQSRGFVANALKTRLALSKKVRD